MTNTQIEKILKLLNDNNLAEATQLLKIELLKNTNTKNVKLIDTVKKYLKNADNSRPVLKTVMIKNGVQFICNGYSLYVFDNYVDELNVLPTTDDNYENVIDYRQVLNKNATYSDIDSHDLKILTNIKKIIAYYKQIDGVDKKSLFTIPFANKFYDAKMILELCNMYNNNFTDLKMYKTDSPLHPIQFTNNKITSILLPVRVLKDDEKDLINSRFNEFLTMLEG